MAIGGIGVGLGSTQQERALIRMLFGAGAQGAFFAPWNLSSMYQDSAGTTPVTAVGQPVGLRLDTRLGLVRGAEMSSSTASTAGWTPVGSSLSAAAGQLTITNTAAAEGLVSPNGALTTVTGTSYEVTFTTTASTTASGNKGALQIGSTRVGLGALGPKRFILPGATGSAIQFGTNDGNVGTVLTIQDVSIRPLPGNHATQSTSTSRPTLQQDAGGRYYLSYDGVDDGMATASIDFTGTAQMTVFAGIYKASDAAEGCIVELSSGYSANNGAFALSASYPANARYVTALRGNANAAYALEGYAAPISNVVTASYDIGGATIAEEMIPRVNGTTPTKSTLTAGPAGTGNFGNYPLYIGRRNNASIPLNGRDYGIVILGRTATATEIARTERWLASRMGVTL